MRPIKNIIFDLGGVLINLDFDRSTRAFAALGFDHFEKMFSQFNANELFEKLEKGTISEDAFYEVLKKAGKKDLTNEQIKFAWNSLLLDFREDSLSFLHALKKDYKLFLLSNTNSIHFDAFNLVLKEQTGLSSLDPLFTKAWYSHLIGLRKPYPEIFEFVQKDAGIQASETLFIDDTIDNIQAAQQLGFNTHHLLATEKIEKLHWPLRSK
jgi:glucose-1-phosphatase